MRKLDLFSFAFANFLRRKARSMLTVFGVIIGTAAVVIMLSIGIGMNKGIEDQIASWGNLREITVRCKTGTYNEETGEWEQAAVVEPLDDISVQKIRDIDGVVAISPMVYSQYTQSLIKDRKSKMMYSDITTDAATMADFDEYQVLYGRLLNESDVGTTNFVMSFNVPFMFNDFDVIKNGNWEDIVYGYESKAGDEIPFNPVNEFDDSIKYEFTWDYNYGTSAIDATKPRIINQEAKCVGILMQNLNGGNFDYSSAIYMDVKGLMSLEEKLKENQDRYNKNSGDGVIYGGVYYYDETEGSTFTDGRENIYNSLTVLVDKVDNVLEVVDAINEMQFETISSMDYVKKQQEQTAFLRGILGAIGAVAFFVAAISIANTMVMSIYERTREIGIMKVIGCKLSDIRSMFLFEAAIIGITGGLMGIGLSYIISIILNKIAAGGGLDAFGIYAAGATLSIIPLWLDIAAVVLATVVGVVSGLYPAIRATRLSALEAIKNE